MLDSRCFALSTVGACTILKIRDSQCGTKGCPFYKTKEKLEKREKEARKRCGMLGVSYKTVKSIK